MTCIEKKRTADLISRHFTFAELDLLTVALCQYAEFCHQTAEGAAPLCTVFRDREQRSLELMSLFCLSMGPD